MLVTPLAYWFFRFFISRMTLARFSESSLFWDSPFSPTCLFCRPTISMFFRLILNCVDGLEDADG